MALLVWYFAGGGETEVNGLTPFLNKLFPNCKFERKTPARYKPGPKPNFKPSTYGITGNSLAVEIENRLKDCLNEKERCDLILVIDDLDCKDIDKQCVMLSKAIDNIEEYQNIERFVGFASPELEAWIIADWDNTMAKHVDFKSRHNGMKHWLNSKGVKFDQPETFSYYDSKKDSCHDKLSELLQKSAEQTEGDRYSKALHTSYLLRTIDPETVKNKCPLFKEMHNFIADFQKRRYND